MERNTRKLEGKIKPKDKYIASDEKIKGGYGRTENTSIPGMNSSSIQRKRKNRDDEPSSKNMGYNIYGISERTIKQSKQSEPHKTSTDAACKLTGIRSSSNDRASDPYNKVCLCESRPGKSGSAASGTSQQLARPRRVWSAASAGSTIAIAQPWAPETDSDSSDTENEETQRKSGTVHPVQETQPPEVDTDSTSSEEETMAKKVYTDSWESRKETKPKQFFTDSTSSDEETNRKEFYKAE